jgi:hypothetical protein
MTARYTAGRYKAWDDNGDPQPLARLYTYVQGTTTQKNAFTAVDGLTPVTYTSDGVGGQYIAMDARGEASLYLSGDYTLTLKTPLGAVIFSDDEDDEINTLQNNLAGTGAGQGAVNIGLRDIGLNYTATEVEGAFLEVAKRGQEYFSAFEFMTENEITAVKAYNFSISVQTALQTAMDAAHAAKRGLYIPAGGYLVTGLVIPGDVVPAGVDDRDKAYHMWGQGFGEPFVQTNTGGTVIKSVTDAPVIRDKLGTAVSSNGTINIHHIRFDGTSTTPVVSLTSFYGLSSLHDCVVYQRGTGDGVFSSYGAQAKFKNIYSMNKDWATFGLGAARVSTGFNLPLTHDSGLLEIQGCTSRGWLTGYAVGGAAGAWIGPSIANCEASITYNGIKLLGTRGALISVGYFEGGDGGIGILDQGDYSSIRDCSFFPGYATHIDATFATGKGTLIEGNTISIGAGINAIGINVTSSGAFGGSNKNVINNAVVCTAGTAGQNGIRINGTDPRVTVMGNAFDPRGAWSGAGTLKINDLSTNGVHGLIQTENASQEVLVLSRGAITWAQQNTALTQTDVVSNVLTLLPGSYFIASATAAATVQQINTGTSTVRHIQIRTTTANMTFQNTAFIKTAAAASFTGPGMITFAVERIGASNFAYEVARTVF